VGEEIAALDRVRTALEGGDAAVAQRELAKYRSVFAQGAMEPEAAMLAVQAAFERGDLEQAASRARSFLARYPKSPHAPRVRVWLTRATTGAKPPPQSGAAPSLATPRSPELTSPTASGPSVPAAASPAAPSEAAAATPSRTPSVARFEE
jgi:hypothetical protein